MAREHEEEEEILVMEKNTDQAEEEWKEKTNEDILKSSAGCLCGINNKAKSEDEEDEISRLKISISLTLMEKKTEVKAETYSGRVNDHTHFTSPPMTTLYDRGDHVKPHELFDQDDYYTSCHYANSHHPDDEYRGTTATECAQLFDQDDNYTSGHYANSHHQPDEEYGDTTTATAMYPPP